MRTALALVAVAVAALPVSAWSGAGAGGTDWARFGFDTARHGVGPAGPITAANVSHLVRQQVHLDGTVDSSAVFLHGTFFVTTTYGRTEAITAASGAVRWRFTPPGYSSWAGSPQTPKARLAVLQSMAEGIVEAKAPAKSASH